MFSTSELETFEVSSEFETFQVSSEFETFENLRMFIEKVVPKFFPLYNFLYSKEDPSIIWKIFQNYNQNIQYFMIQRLVSKIKSSRI